MSMDMLLRAARFVEEQEQELKRRQLQELKQRQLQELIAQQQHQQQHAAPCVTVVMTNGSGNSSSSRIASHSQQHMDATQNHHVTVPTTSAAPLAVRHVHLKSPPSATQQQLRPPPQLLPVSAAATAADHAAVVATASLLQQLPLARVAAAAATMSATKTANIALVEAAPPDVTVPAVISNGGTHNIILTAAPIRLKSNGITHNHLSLQHPSVTLTTSPVPSITVSGGDNNNHISTNNSNGNNGAATVLSHRMTSNFEVTPLVIDELSDGGGKRRQSPGHQVMRIVGTREVHNKLERDRRKHLKFSFDELKKELPNMDEKKTSNLSILHTALSVIENLKNQTAAQDEELQRLRTLKHDNQQRLAAAKFAVGTSRADALLASSYPPSNGNSVATLLAAQALSFLPTTTTAQHSISTAMDVLDGPAMNGPLTDQSVKMESLAPVKVEALSSAMSAATAAAIMATVNGKNGTRPAAAITLNGLKEGLNGATIVPVPVSYPAGATGGLVVKNIIVPKTTFSVLTTGGSGPQTYTPGGGGSGSVGLPLGSLRLAATSPVQVAPLSTVYAQHQQSVTSTAGTVKYVMKPAVAATNAGTTTMVVVSGTSARGTS